MIHELLGVSLSGFVKTEIILYTKIRNELFLFTVVRFLKFP